LSFGVALAALLLHFSTAGRGAAVLNASNFTPAFMINGVLSIAAVIFFFPLEHHAGAEVSGRHAPVIISGEIETVTEVD
jgi:hypothetical protein